MIFVVIFYNLMGSDQRGISRIYLYQFKNPGKAGVWHLPSGACLSYKGGGWWNWLAGTFLQVPTCHTRGVKALTHRHLPIGAYLSCKLRGSGGSQALTFRCLLALRGVGASDLFFCSTFSILNDYTTILKGWKDVDNISVTIVLTWLHKTAWSSDISQALTLP